MQSGTASGARDLLELTQRLADQLFHRGSCAQDVDAIRDGLGGLALFVAQGDEGENGIGLAALIFRRFEGAGGRLPCFGDPDLVLEFENNSFCGFASHALELG